MSAPHILSVPWLVGEVTPADEAQMQRWLAARDAWLAAAERRTGSKNTARAYRTDWLQFFRFIQHPPWLIAVADADAWLRELVITKAAASTANRKMSSLSSYYDFVARWTYTDDAGQERTLCMRPNPFRKPTRPPHPGYRESHYIKAADVRRCLAMIRRHTALGARDYALIAAYLYTGRRSSEIANLRWADISVDAEREGRYYYTWTGKNGKTRQDELPGPVYHAIVEYLRIANRWEPRPADYVFQPIDWTRALNLPTVGASASANLRNKALSSNTINRIVKRRFALAGIDPQQIHTHTLRHTAAHLRYRDGAGQDVLAISQLLGHSNVATTQVYLHTNTTPVDSGWTEVHDILDVEPSPAAKRVRRLKTKK